MVEIDASHGEGGGQLVRLAVALAALTGTAVRLVNVRAGRPRPGLAPQHLAALHAVASLCAARCEGLELRSRALTFAPDAPVAGGSIRVDVGTAGSATLVLQALLPLLLCARVPSHVVVTGGTDVRQAPTWDYFVAVLLPLLARMGAKVDAHLVRRGYYPQGGGEVALAVAPGRLEPLVLDAPARSWRIRGEAQVARLPLAIAERMRDAALGALPLGADVRASRLAPDQAFGAGGAITVWAEGEAGRLGAARVAERGVPAEAIGAAVGEALAAELAGGALLDVHAADQVLVFTALAGGDSTFTTRALSSHARTAMWLLPQFLPVRFTTEPAGAVVRLHCSITGRTTRGMR